MFNLENAIQTWKRQLRSNPAFEDGDIAELVSHLRDEIERLKTEGLSEEEAFKRAIEEIGEPEPIGDELYKSRATQKAGPVPSWRQKSWIPSLLPNYLKVAMKNSLKQKTYFFINIAGLAIGIACCLLIFLYVTDELSYDTYHQNSDELYRVAKTRTAGGNEFNSAWSQVPMGPAIESNFPGVREAIRFWRAFEPVVGYEENYFNESGNLYFTDPEVFEAFSFSLVQGDPDNVLEQPGSVVLSQATAKKYFGDQNPIGKVLSYNGYPAEEVELEEIELTVTGLMENLPSNTQFQFEMLATMSGIETEQNNWGSHKPIWTYLWLEEGTDLASLEKNLPEFLDNQQESSAVTDIVDLELLTSVHLYSGYDGGFKPGGNITYVYLFSLIGFFLLLIACINFTNLSTARSLTRAGEVGVRKTLGASRVDLVKQFMGEAFLISGLAVLLALILAEMALPVLNGLADKHLFIPFGDGPGLMLKITTLWICVALLAGLYPAFLQSRYKPVLVLGNKMGKETSGETLRKGLVVFQFAISIILIVSTITIYSQMDYITSKNLGFDKELVVVVPYSSNEEMLLNRFEEHTGIISASVSQRVPVNTISSDGRSVELPSGEEPIRVESYVIDDQFLETYKMNIVAGRNISDDLASDSSAFLINETAVREFGWSNPDEAIGKSLVWNGDKPGRIVGVVEDFHMTSLHEQIEPLVMHTIRNYTWWRTFITVRLAPGDVASVLPFLEENWRELTPEGVFDYFFIDQSLEELHTTDKRMGQILGFSLIAIFIACLGLFGLATFAVERRTKEIGIRKVLGATVTQIAALLNKEFLKLILLSFLISIPVAWFFIDRWLQEFVYHIEIGIGLFLLAGVAVIFIALVTISGQSIRASLMNPVKSLRSE